MVHFIVPWLISAKLKNVKIMAENVVPPIERAEIVSEAKQSTLYEIARRSKSINDLPVTEEYIGKKLELSSGEAISAETFASQIQQNTGPVWEDE